MADKHIKHIAIGPQQLQFGFEGNAFEEQDLLLACITDHMEKHGWVDLDQLVQVTAASFDWTEFTTLQNVFYLAYDLKIHFRKNGKNIELHVAKKHLIESQGQQVHVVLNQPVDEAVFQSVKNFFMKLSGRTSTGNYGDQYEFSRLLAQEILLWKSSLESYQSLACQPYYPGKKEIDAGLDFIKMLTLKLDSFSLMHAFFDNREAIVKLVKAAKIIFDFYTQHRQTWQTLAHFAGESKKSMAELKADPKIAKAYERFNLIISMSQPYDRVDEAYKLMNKVKPYHDRIIANQTQRCRMAAVLNVERFIQKMKAHLDAHTASKDLRHQSLYPMRLAIKVINGAGTINKINLYMQEAEETFEATWEKVLESQTK